MKKKIDIKIYGGCVSRDILNFDKSNALQLISYNARSSLATLGAENASKIIPNEYYDSLKNIDSNFQRRMVECDFSNDILNSVNNIDYDILLLDLLVERFHLADVGGKIVTRSSEFVRSGIEPNSIINTFSSHYLDEWYKGVDNFFSVIDNVIGLDAIRVNKVYWSSIATNSQDTSELNKKWPIQESNEKLNLMYQYIEKILPKKSIINIPKESMIADPEHKWGFSPFHYTDNYYKVALEMLINSSS